ncbi:class I SAM-dependent methyltransferase [Anaerosporobacter faecicola]|uniref:class I SAM-dependent methyltransferase n=1 Tax=Anaerosporobacter faecicola TaxID=2718714 RepID=UPI00143AA925|nr:class I SAM-dependent methyltransferase [Anaerosporobacter faecicola]
MTIEPYKGIAEIYEEIRPSYPQELIQDIINSTYLSYCDRILEIGAGTGKATTLFAERGYGVHAIEIGEDMAEILRKKCSPYQLVTVEVCSFEDWINSEKEEYHLIYSAQAFHWIKKEIKYKKCYDLLEKAGYLVLFWYAPTNNKSFERLKLDEQINKIVDQYIKKSEGNKRSPCKDSEKQSVGQSEKQSEEQKDNHIEKNTSKLPVRRTHTGVYSADERKKEIEESGLFQIIEQKEYLHKIINTPEQYVQAMRSVPAFASCLDRMEESIIKELENKIISLIIAYGGYVEEEFQYSLYIAQKFVRV